MCYATIGDGGTQDKHPPMHTHTHSHMHSYSHTYMHRLSLMPTNHSLAPQVLDELDPAERQRVTLWSSRGASQGGCLMRGHWLAAQGKSAKEIVADVEQWYVGQGVKQAVILKTITFLRNGGRFDQIQKRLLGLVGVVLNTHERKGNGMAALYDNCVIDPKKPDTAKAQLKGFGSTDVLEPKMAKVLGKFAKQVGGQFDVFVSHFAEPWRVPSIVALLREEMSVRNVYVGESEQREKREERERDRTGPRSRVILVVRLSNEPECDLFLCMQSLRHDVYSCIQTHTGTWGKTRAA